MSPNGPPPLTAIRSHQLLCKYLGRRATDLTPTGLALQSQAEKGSTFETRSIRGVVSPYECHHNENTRKQSSQAVRGFDDERVRASVVRTGHGILPRPPSSTAGVHVFVIPQLRFAIYNIWTWLNLMAEKMLEWWLGKCPSRHDWNEFGNHQAMKFVLALWQALQTHEESSVRNND
ncbi:hypothetical protein CcaCcLH18_11995 [Colletotrichum camelliae]|nr:hypothetical protein CcaCcLH18_11995 [Colletotrichum camelliae]